MPYDSTFSPRLSDMRRLGDTVGFAGTLDANIEAARKQPRVNPPEMFDEREGYQDDFLGEFVVPWPVPLAAGRKDLLHVEGNAKSRLDYTHFSVAMSRSRKLAMFVGVNISGEEHKSIKRDSDKWFYDGRIPVEAQAGEELYADNLLDRGHLVRREDPNWGDEAATANEDTFHFTNCSPQMAAFNQKTWLSLENYVLLNTKKWKERVTVFSGAMFRDTDRTYRGIKIPTAYWKVIAFVGDDGRRSATAYMIDQSNELRELEAAFGKFKTYQRSVAYVQRTSGVDFGDLSRYDGFSNEERETGTTIEAVVESAADMRV